MLIKDGKVVDLSYILKTSDGELLDRADSEDPFVYLHGSEQIVPGLEKALDGLTVGDKKVVVVTPEEGYGIHDPQLKQIARRDQFPADVELEEGIQFEVRSDQGEDVVFTVQSIEGDQVHIDGNHPLAGETLHFDVEVLAVRDATEEEKSHGHVHGADGHHH